MGPGIGQVLAASGHPVQIFNRTRERLETVHERVERNLNQMADYDLVDRGQISAILGRITVTTKLEEACKNASIVFESIPESLELKQNLFADLDRICPPETCLCSNTSVISITAIGARTAHPERVIGTHFYQPPFLVPLVEVVRTEKTKEDRFDHVFNTLKDAGKVPIHVRKDVPGFVANRMQHALWREAFALIDSGVCDAETVDIAVSNSFGMRLPVLGPVANADFVGLELTFAIHDYILQYLDVSTQPSSTLRKHIAAGELGFKTGSGFLKWNEQTIAERRSGLSTYLLEFLSRKKRAAASD